MKSYSKDLPNIPKETYEKTLEQAEKARSIGETVQGKIDRLDSKLDDCVDITVDSLLPRALQNIDLTSHVAKRIKHLMILIGFLSVVNIGLTATVIALLAGIITF